MVAARLQGDETLPAARHSHHHTIPYHTIPHQTTPHPTKPYHNIYHTIPNYTQSILTVLLYHTIPYHTKPYHTTCHHSLPLGCLLPPQTHFLTSALFCPRAALADEREFWGGWVLETIFQAAVWPRLQWQGSACNGWWSGLCTVHSMIRSIRWAMKLPVV